MMMVVADRSRVRGAAMRQTEATVKKHREARAEPSEFQSPRSLHHSGHLEEMTCLVMSPMQLTTLAER